MFVFMFVRTPQAAATERPASRQIHLYLQALRAASYKCNGPAFTFEGNQTQNSCVYFGAQAEDYQRHAGLTHKEAPFFLNRAP